MEQQLEIAKKQYDELCLKIGKNFIDSKLMRKVDVSQFYIYKIIKGNVELQYSKRLKDLIETINHEHKKHFSNENNS